MQRHGNPDLGRHLAFLRRAILHGENSDRAQLFFPKTVSVKSGFYNTVTGTEGVSQSLLKILHGQPHMPLLPGCSSASGEKGHVRLPRAAMYKLGKGKFFWLGLKFRRMDF